MDAQPPPPDPTLRLPGDTSYQIVHTLRGLLPPPVTDTPEDLARRDNAAIARIASLLPGNADEANIAACYVAADAYAMDLLRLARESRGDPTFFLKCTTRATGMMREARAARSALTRVQAERRERDADSAAADRAAWAEHCAIGLMMDALGEAPPAVTAESPPPTAHPPAPDDEPATDAIAAAKRHAIIGAHPGHGRLAPQCHGHA